MRWGRITDSFVKCILSETLRLGLQFGIRILRKLPTRGASQRRAFLAAGSLVWQRHHKREAARGESLHPRPAPRERPRRLSTRLHSMVDRRSARAGLRLRGSGQTNECLGRRRLPRAPRRDCGLALGARRKVSAKRWQAPAASRAGRALAGVAPPGARIAPSVSRSAGNASDPESRAAKKNPAPVIMHGARCGTVRTVCYCLLLFVTVCYCLLLAARG